MYVGLYWKMSSKNMKTNRRRVSGGRGSLWTNKAQRALYVLQGHSDDDDDDDDGRRDV